MNRRLGLAVAAAATLVASLTFTGTAAAYDAYPCHSPRAKTFSWGGYTYSNVTVRTCRLWTGYVPVRSRRDPNAPPVGYLTYGGNANWFVAETWGNIEFRGGSYNGWWASTMADNGRWGWVNEVYFSGGGNNEDDAGLLMPPSSYPCGNTCPPIPVWWWY